MTGKEFLEKVRAIEQITDIRWQVMGDALDPAEVKVVFVADGEEVTVSYPKPDDESRWIHEVAIGLLINKFMEQVGEGLRVSLGDDVAQAVNYSRKQIKKGERQNV